MFARDTDALLDVRLAEGPPTAALLLDARTIELQVSASSVVAQSYSLVSMLVRQPGLVLRSYSDMLGPAWHGVQPGFSHG